MVTINLEKVYNVPNVGEKKVGEVAKAVLRDKKPCPLTISEIKRIWKDANSLETADMKFANDEELLVFLDEHRSEILSLVRSISDEKRCGFDLAAFRRWPSPSLRRDCFFVLFDVTPKKEKEQPKEQPVEVLPPDLGANSEPETDVPETEVGELPTLEDLQEIYTRKKGMILKEEKDFDCSNDLTFYAGMDITIKDEFCFEVKSKQITTRCVAIAQPSSKAVAIVGKLQKKDEKYYLLADRANIAPEKWNKRNTKAQVIFFPLQAETYIEQGKLTEYPGDYFAGDVTVKLVDLPTTEATLCIDFGTSNTTAGSYGLIDKDGEKPEIVTFYNPLSSEYEKMLPTLMCVQHIKEDEVSYLFGYAAKQKIINADYTPEVAVFREIKRWIGDHDNLNVKENVWDEEGNTTEVPRRDLLKEYLKYVIEQAEAHFKHKFKYIHFTAPVRTKRVFLREITPVIKELGYTVKSEVYSIDEATAVIYNFVHQEVLGKGEKKLGENEERCVTIIDCGGGTTDVAQCVFKWENINAERADKYYARKLVIETQYTNGDSNYAGNSITFRILQLLKIKIAHKLDEQFANNFASKNDGKLTALELVGKEGENTILQSVDDKNDKEEIYKVFEELYAQAEQIIPTKFDENVPSMTRGDKKKRMRNYYYLWEIAEQVKKSFFKRVAFDFSKKDDLDLLGDVTKEKEYYLYHFENKNLVKVEAPLQAIEIDFKEVNRIIYADIYKLLKDVMPEKLPTDQSARYKLSGQSCNLELFHDLLKEFIPGKLTRMEKKKSKEGENEKYLLKMYCINGSIQYLLDKDTSKIDPEFTMKNPILNYKVRCVSEREDFDALASEEDKIKTQAVGMTYTSKFAKFETIKVDGSKEGAVVGHQKYQLKLNEKGVQVDQGDAVVIMKKETYVDDDILTEVWKNVLSTAALDNDDRKHFCLAALPAKNGYGFNVFQFTVDKAGYWLIKQPTFFPFVDEKLDTYFAGNR